MTAPSSSFLFDEHMSVAAAQALRERGVDVIHVLDSNLRGSPDARVLAYAQEHGRILVTRNYGDFAALAAAYARRDRSFPGILFVPSSLRPGDVGGLVTAIYDWVVTHRDVPSPVADGYGWL